MVIENSLLFIPDAKLVEQEYDKSVRDKDAQMLDHLIIQAELIFSWIGIISHWTCTIV